MLKDIASLLFGGLVQRAPKTLSKALSPMHYRQSQSGNLDMDLVVGAVTAAQGGDITPLLSLYRDIEVTDPTIQSAIMTRKLSVLARGFNVVAADNSGAAGEAVADAAQAMLKRSNTFVDACTWLLHGCIWPVSVVEKRWVPGGGGFSHPEFRLVPLELFDFTEKTLRIKRVDSQGALMAETHAPSAVNYLVHRGHMLMAPDNWGGPLRALVFWYLFSTQDREWWARFLERFGAPFLIGTYDKNDEDSRMMLTQAFQEATRLFGVVATSETQIKIEQATGTQGASEAFKVFHECAKDEKLLLILGQTLSAKAASTGMGSGVAGLQSQVREDVKLWDAFKLADTIRTGVIEPWMKMNSISGPTPTLVFGGFDPAKMAEMGQFLESLNKSGLELADDSIGTISRQAGVTLQRAKLPAAPVLPGKPDPMLALAASGLPISTLANESVTRDAAADQARAFSGDLAPLGEIVATSATKAELLQRAGAFLSGYRTGKAAELLQEALNAHGVNALATRH
jgi:phage gp29-like protein